MNNCCKVPFTEIEISVNGDVYVCCPAKMSVSIGNIYKEPFEKIWHSQTAQDLRQDILNHNYSKCNLTICNPNDNIEQDKLDLMQDKNIDFCITPPFPKYVKFCHDLQCNIQCITCRDNKIINSPEKLKELNQNIYKTYLPILKNCEIVSLNGAGEVFASKHCRELVKAIVKEYPDIKFDLHTNGILCDKKNCDELGITDKIVSIDISMHAYNKETYQKIMVGSDYDKVVENIKWLSGLKKIGQLKHLDLYFVVQKMNYKEMKDFVKFAEENDADVYFWEYRNWGNNLGQEYGSLAVFEKFHPEYQDFAHLLQDEIFKKHNCHLNNYLMSIKPISLKEQIKAKLKYFFQYKNLFSVRNQYKAQYKYKILKILNKQILLKTSKFVKDKK